MLRFLIVNPVNQWIMIPALLINKYMTTRRFYLIIAGIENR